MDLDDKYILVHCGRGFRPLGEPVRLVPDEQNRAKYKVQDVLIGFCPICEERVMSWHGIDWAGEISERQKINPRNHTLWLERCESGDKLTKFYYKGTMSVWGSNNEFPYQLRKVPVR